MLLEMEYKVVKLANNITFTIYSPNPPPGTVVGDKDQKKETFSEYRCFVGPNGKFYTKDLPFMRHAYYFVFESAVSTVTVYKYGIIAVPNSGITTDSRVTLISEALESKVCDVKSADNSEVTLEISKETFIVKDTKRELHLVKGDCVVNKRVFLDTPYDVGNGAVCFAVSGTSIIPLPNGRISSILFPNFNEVANVFMEFEKNVLVAKVSGVKCCDGPLTIVANLPYNGSCQVDDRMVKLITDDDELKILSYSPSPSGEGKICLTLLHSHPLNFDFVVTNL